MTVKLLLCVLPVLLLVLLLAVATTIPARIGETFATVEQCRPWFTKRFENGAYQLRLSKRRAEHELALFDILFWTLDGQPLDLCAWHRYFTDRLRNYARPWHGTQAKAGARWTLVDDVKSLDWSRLAFIATYLLRRAERRGADRRLTRATWCRERTRLRRHIEGGIEAPTKALSIPNAWRRVQPSADNRAARFRPYFYEADLDDLRDHGYAIEVPSARARKVKVKKKVDAAEEAVSQTVIFDERGNMSIQFEEKGVGSDKTAMMPSQSQSQSHHVHPAHHLYAGDKKIYESTISMPFLLPRRADRALNFKCLRPWHMCQSHNLSRTPRPPSASCLREGK